MIITTRKNRYFLEARKNFYYIHPNLYRQILSSNSDNDYYKKKLKVLNENKHFDAFNFDFRGRFTKKSLSMSLANTFCVDFEVTERCNLNCYYCAYGKFYNNIDERKDKDIEINKAILFFDYIVDYLNSSQSTLVDNPIYLGFYGGEPLLNFKAIKNIIEYSKRLKLKNKNFFKYFMTTNGVLLNKYADFLARNDFILTISLDGNEKHNSFRTFHNGKESFRLIYNNIKQLQSKYPKYFEDRVSFNTVLHKKNSPNEVKEFFKSEFSKIPRMSTVSDIGFNDEFESIFKDKFHKENEMESSDNSCYNLLKSYGGIVKENYYDLYMDQEFSSFLPTGTCFPFSRRCYMTVNGKILPCEKVGHEFVFGTVDGDGVHLDLELLAKRLNECYKEIKSQCKKCVNLFNCTKCIFCMPFKNNKPICTEVKHVNKNVKDLEKAVERIENDLEYFNFLIEEYNEL